MWSNLKTIVVRPHCIPKLALFVYDSIVHEVGLTEDYVPCFVHQQGEISVLKARNPWNWVPSELEGVNFSIGEVEFPVVSDQGIGLQELLIFEGYDVKIDGGGDDGACGVGKL